MPWPYINADGSLRPFTVDEVKALGLYTTEVEQGDHPTYELDSQGCSVRRMWFCDWLQRDNAMAYLLGASKVYGTAPNISLSRVMPQSFPGSGWEQYAALALESVKGARSAGKDDSSYLPAYKSAKLNVRHEQVFFGLYPDGEVPEYNRYVEQLPSTVETSYLSVPGSMMKYFRAGVLDPPNGVLIPYNVGRPEVLTRISYKWWRVPYEAWRPGSPLYLRVHGDPSNLTITPVTGDTTGFGKRVGFPYIGCVSSAEMLGYPSGCALFEGVEEEIVPDPVRGFLCWNLTFKFLVKNTASAENIDGGHNYIYYGGQAGDSRYAGYYFAAKDKFYYNGQIPDGVTLFCERNLLNLWNVGAVADANI